MAISSATMQFVVSATAAESAAVTTYTAVTAKRDTFAFANGTGSLEATGVIDVNITIAGGATVTALSTLVDTLENAFAYTELKGVRIFNAAANANVTITSNITGFPVGVLLPNSTLGMATSFANGLTIAGTNTITVTGTNTNVVTLTLLVS
jgi:hypothetical protein